MDLCGASRRYPDRGGCDGNYRNVAGARQSCDMGAPLASRRALHAAARARVTAGCASPVRRSRADTEAGVLLAAGNGGRATDRESAHGRRAGACLWLAVAVSTGDLVFEHSGLQVGSTHGSQFGHLGLVNLVNGDRRQLAWPSYFGAIIRVAVEPHGPFVAVDFGSPAYPGPAQAEDIWISTPPTGAFSHLPDYPAQVDIKVSNVVWTNDDRLVIVAHGGGRSVLGIWKPGEAMLPLRTVPNRQGYNAFIPIIG